MSGSAKVNLSTAMGETRRIGWSDRQQAFVTAEDTDGDRVIIVEVNMSLPYGRTIADRIAKLIREELVR